MGMKLRSVAGAVVAALIVGMLVMPSSSGAVKAGTSCKKAGLQTTDSGRKYTCVKQGKKFVWNKGVVVKAAPVVKPTPSATPSPAESPTLSDLPRKNLLGNYIYRYVNGIQERKNIDNVWRSSDARKESDFDPIRVAAFNSINNMERDSSIKNLNLIYDIQANYPAEIASTIKSQVTKISQIISPVLGERVDVRIVLFTEKDQEFLKNDLKKYGVSEEHFSILKDYVSLDRFYSRGGTGGGTAGYRENEKYGYYLGHTSSLATIDTYWPQVVPHEMAHFLQFYIARGGWGTHGEGHPEAKFHGHFIEGSANTIGMASGFELLGWYSDEMDMHLKSNIKRNADADMIKNASDAAAFIETIETRDSQINDAFSYSAGQFVWEFYIGKYGFNKYLDLLKSLSKTSNFNQSLKITIGKDRKEFYSEAGEYLFSNWDRLSK
jgi:hypothetical protein